MANDKNECGAERVKRISVSVYSEDGSVAVDHGWTSVAFGERIVPRIDPNNQQPGAEPEVVAAGEVTLRGPVTAGRGYLSALLAGAPFRFGIDWHQGSVVYLDGCVVSGYRPPSIGGGANVPLVEQLTVVFSQLTASDK